MVDFVCVLSLLAVLLVGLVFQHLHSFSAARLVLAGLCHRVQLAHLVLGPQGTQQVGLKGAVFVGSAGYKR